MSEIIRHRKREPLIFEEWDYDESVKKMKEFVGTRLKVDYYMALELYNARERLRAPGRRTDLEPRVNEPRSPTWEQYCKDIGSNKSTINRWLNWYFRIKEISEEKQRLLDMSKLYPPSDDDIKVILGDFMELCKDIPDNSVDLILTDPPYAEKYIPLWEGLASISSRLLKPSGFLVAMSGKLFLNRIIRILDGSGLKYYWMYCLKLPGENTRLWNRHIYQTWKPFLIYENPPIKPLDEWGMDSINSLKQEKELGDWQQSESSFEYMVDKYSNVGELVLDPMCGYGTTPVACKKLKRKCLAIDISEDAIKTTKGRLMEVNNE